MKPGAEASIHISRDGCRYLFARRLAAVERKEPALGVAGDIGDVVFGNRAAHHVELFARGPEHSIGKPDLSLQARVGSAVFDVIEVEIRWSESVPRLKGDSIPGARTAAFHLETVAPDQARYHGPRVW